MRELCLTVTSDFSNDWLETHATPEDRTALLNFACSLPREIEASADVERILAELEPRIRMQADARYVGDVSMLKTELNSIRQEKDRMKQLLEDADAACKDQRAKMEDAFQELKELQSDRALHQARIREECDARQMDARRVHQDHLLQLKQLYESQLLAKTEELERVRSECREDMDRSRKERDGQSARVEQMLSTLSGTNQRRGAVGENFVKQIHDGLNLGLYSKNAHQKNAGFGDATWTYAHPNGGPVLTALTEVKLSHSADSASDVDKFLKDVDAGVRTQRINSAIYLSLASRLGGKARLDLEVVHGVPVLWASRATEDELSAASLVDTVFTMFSTLWPLLCAREEEGRGGAVVLQQVVVLLNAQLDEISKLEPRISFLEKTGDQMRREAAMLRKSRDALSSQISTFQVSHPELQMECRADNADVVALETATLDAVRTFHSRRHGHYPKHSDELRSMLSPGDFGLLSKRPGIFETCVRIVRGEKQLTKRKREVHAEEGEGGPSAE